MNIKKILSILLAAICASTFVFALCACGSAEKEKSAAANNSTGTVQAVTLDVSMQKTREGLDVYPSYTLTAIVGPDSAQNKEVDWSIAWRSSSAPSLSVTDYLTLTPESDGATTATLTCKKSFRGYYAVVTVTTREHHLTDTCLVTYVGKPEGITFDPVVISQMTTTERDVTAFAIKAGETQEIAFAPDNVLHDVGEQFNNFEVKVEGIGQFQVKRFGGDMDDPFSVYDLNDYVDKFISVSIEDGKLVIEAKGRYEEYDVWKVYSKTGERYEEVYNKDWNSKPYYLITLTLVSSWLSENISATLPVYIVPGVTTVALNANTVSF